MRYIIISILFISAFIIVYLIYDANFSNRVILGKKNETNALKLKIGMTRDSVVKIMGKPEKTYGYYDSGGVLVMRYTSTNGDFLDIEIRTNNNGKVIDVFIFHAPFSKFYTTLPNIEHIIFQFFFHFLN